MFYVYLIISDFCLSKNVRHFLFGLFYLKFTDQNYFGLQDMQPKFAMSLAQQIYVVFSPFKYINLGPVSNF